ncbi:MAG: hypothetical protein ACP5XB_01650 [Isosphaeraceae bacterium]
MPPQVGNRRLRQAARQGKPEHVGGAVGIGPDRQRQETSESDGPRVAGRPALRDVDEPVDRLAQEQPGRFRVGACQLPGRERRQQSLHHLVVILGRQRAGSRQVPRRHPEARCSAGASSMPSGGLGALIVTTTAARTRAPLTGLPSCPRTRGGVLASGPSTRRTDSSALGNLPLNSRKAGQ